MCLFSKSVSSVSKTRLIYAQARDGNGARWAIQTYSNQVSLEPGAANTVMILPVPAKSDLVKLLNREGDATVDRIFAGLHARFENEKPMDLLSFSFGGSYGSNSLEVIQSGGYDVTVVPTLADLARLDQSVFGFPDPVLQRILTSTDESRTGGFSYLAFVLRSSAVYTPFAYMYPLVETDTAAFIPTKHHHPHTAGTSASAASSNGQWADDWDHEIFILGQSPAAPLTLGMDAFRATKLVQPAYFAFSELSNFIKGTASAPPSLTWFDSAYQLVIKGRKPNADVTFPVAPADSGVFCDACKKTIRGYRYKCITCNDVDLCRECMVGGKRTGLPAHDGQQGHPVIELKNGADLQALVDLLSAKTACARAMAQMKVARAALQ